MKRKQEPGRALAQGGVFLLVRLFSVRACAPFAKSEHKAFREKAPSEEKNLRWCCCDAEEEEEEEEEAQRGPERRREALERRRHAQRGPERSREAQSGPERPREAQRPDRSQSYARVSQTATRMKPDRSQHDARMKLEC